MSLHVNIDTRKTVPFPADIAARIEQMQASHAMLPRPEAAGRRIAMPRPA
jgi:acyl-CoA thioester hydrolase